MKLVVFISICIAGSSGYSTRVINGTQVTLGEFPYIVSIQIFGRHNCDGSILDATHILTAAHCVQGFESHEFYIQYGVVDLKETRNKIKVSDRVYHAGFKRTYLFFDIAILTLEKSIKFDVYAQPVQLSEPWALTPENAPPVLAGWVYQQTDGITSRYLMKVDLTVLEDDVYEATYTNYKKPTNSEIQLCSGVARRVQIGIVSWSRKPCTKKGLLGVFTKVSMYLRWINKQIQNSNK
ncbi:serine protease 55-like [Atheta coriaria]|uniref:serine protease 55-like n=1 Tax=Dalotia coriaria TaxID=877792 RepID=UPI0031F4348A